MKNEVIFYPKLALSNMKKNAGIYFPYLLAGVLLAGLYYTVLAVGQMAMASGMKGGAEITMLLEMCASLCVVFMLLILFYINSFVMKRRKRELGLYCILGMEKRHLCVVLFWEVFFAAFISVLCGILFGVLFSQLMFLVLLKILKIPAMLLFAVPFRAVAKTGTVFLGGYLVTILYDWRVIARTKPIDLLKSRAEGEREPKTKWLMTLVGVATMAAGYSLALRVKTPSEGIFAFFPAAFLVMIGTYCLFLAGSIVLLKFLKRRKSFYYRPENFISVSGMLYRMKQNAAGLSTIAILSTALLVVLSSSVTLYAGEEGLLAGMFPREYKMETRPAEDPEAGSAQKMASDSVSYQRNIGEALQALDQETGAGLSGLYSIISVWWVSEKDGGHFDRNVLSDPERRVVMEQMSAIVMISLEDYNEMTQKEEELAPDEVIFVASDEETYETVSILGEEFRVKEQLTRLPQFPDDTMINGNMFGNYIAVVPDRKTMMRLRNEDSSMESLTCQILFGLEGDRAAREEFLARLPERIPGGRLENKSETREGFYLLYGSILFIGLLFVCLFLLATAIIIYYKQVTEGYDDRERFVIMEKVGMRDAEIRRAIGKQVLIVFFLPLVTAVIHICVAARVLQMFLSVLGLSNADLFWKCILVCCLLFGVVYYAIYRLTSRVYYRIVHA